MTSGAVESRTLLIGLAKLRFNFPNWGDEFNSNMQIIDALLGSLSGSVRGPWQIGTVYAVGERVVSAASGNIYEVLIAHTSPLTGTIEDDIAANPGRWRVTTSNAVFRGEWTPGTFYGNNSSVLVGSAYYIATTDHTSGASFSTDLTSGKWTTFVDLQAIVDQVIALRDETQELKDLAAAIVGVDLTNYLLKSEFITYTAATALLLDTMNTTIATNAANALDLSDEQIALSIAYSGVK